MQSPFPLGFNDNIYHEGNISKMPDFDVFSVLECKKRKSRSHGKRKNGNIKRKICTEKRLKIVNEYDQEIPQSQTADNPVAPRGRAAQPSRDTRKTN